MDQNIIQKALSSVKATAQKILTPQNLKSAASYVFGGPSASTQALSQVAKPYTQPITQPVINYAKQTVLPAVNYNAKEFYSGFTTPETQKLNLNPNVNINTVPFARQLGEGISSIPYATGFDPSAIISGTGKLAQAGKTALNFVQTMPQWQQRGELVTKGAEMIPGLKNTPIPGIVSFVEPFITENPKGALKNISKVKNLIAERPKINIPTDDVQALSRSYDYIKKAPLFEQQTKEGGAIINEFQRTADNYLQKLGFKVKDIKRMTDDEKWLNIQPEIQKNIQLRTGVDVGGPKMGITGETKGLTPEVTNVKLKTETGTKLRGFPETVIETKGIPKEVTDLAQTLTYEPLSNQTTLKNVSKIVKKGDSFAINFAKTDESVNGNATAMVMIRKLIDKGRFDEANDLIASVSPRFTKQGQEIQILSQWSKLKPEGAIRYAQTLIDKANKANPKLNLRLTPENTQLIVDKAKALEGLAEGSREKIVATAQLMKEISNVVPVSVGQKISSFQTIMQLLNFKTPIRNILGNTIFGAVENVSDVVGTGIDQAVSMFTGKRSKVLPSLTAQGKGLIRGGKEGFQDVMLGIDTSGGINTQFNLPNETFKGGVLGALEKTLGVTLKVPDRAAATAAFEGSLNNQMRAAGVTKATPQMIETATADALYKTFQDNSKLAQMFGGIKKILNKVGTPDGKFGLGDLILKYPKTPANILSRGLDYTPTGFIKGLYEVSRPLLEGREFNQKAFVEDLSRALVGTGLISGAYVLAKNGVITGKSPKDYDVSATQQSTGGGQFKVNVSALKRFLLSGGAKQEQRAGDTVVSYDWAQPTSLLFSMGADMALNGSGKNAITDALDTSTQTLTNQPLVSGLTSLTKDVQESGIGTALTKSALGSASGFTPSILNQFASLFDTTSRSTYDPNKLVEAKNKVQARIPVLRNQLQPSVDVFGNEKRNYESTGLQRVIDVMFNPSFVSTVKNNESAKEVLDIYSRSGETQQAPRVAQKKIKINGKDIQLNSDQYTQYQKYIGTKTQQVFDSLISDPKFQQATDEDKAKLMASVLSDINSAAKIELFGNKPKNIESGTKKIMGLSSTTSPQITPSTVSFTKEGNLKLSTSGSDLTPPKLTGQNELDKKLISSFNGKITTAINEIVNNYNNGSLSSNEANSQISQLKAMTVKYPKKIKTIKPKKVALKKVSIPKVKKLKVKAIKIPKIKKINIAKLNKPKTIKLKTKKIKV